MFPRWVNPAVEGLAKYWLGLGALSHFGGDGVISGKETLGAMEGFWGGLGGRD